MKSFQVLSKFSNNFLPFSSNCREIYPRVLECILQTELPELMLNNKDEILDTLDTIANDTGEVLSLLLFLLQFLIMEKDEKFIQKENFKCLCMFMAQRKAKRKSSRHKK